MKRTTVITQPYRPRTSRPDFNAPPCLPVELSLTDSSPREPSRGSSLAPRDLPQLESDSSSPNQLKLDLSSPAADSVIVQPLNTSPKKYSANLQSTQNAHPWPLLFRVLSASGRMLGFSASAHEALTQLRAWGQATSVVSINGVVARKIEGRVSLCE